MKQNEQEQPEAKRRHGAGRVFPRGSVLWIAYSLRGREFRESAKTDDPKKAERFLKHRVKETGADSIGAKPFVPPQSQRLTVNELLDALERDLRLRGKSSPSVISNVKHLCNHFGAMRAVDVNADSVARYIEGLLAEEYSNASVNRKTQLLGQSYKLAIRTKRLGEIPYIQHLSETGNARQGFFCEAEIRRVATHLPNYLSDVALFGFMSGWRRGEILSLEWTDVDNDCIRLRAEHSKNGEGRVLVLAGELAEIIERRRVQAFGSLVFQHNGRGIVDLRKAWGTACRLAGIKGRLFHDLRRSAVRNMIRAGVSEHTAMRISGHKTHAMLNRYNIVSETDLRTALETTQEYLKATAEKSPAVLTTAVQ